MEPSLALTHVATHLPSSPPDGAATARANRPSHDGAMDRAVHRHGRADKRHRDVTMQDPTPKFVSVI